MFYLGIDTIDLTRKGAIHTANEIAQQPELWEKIWQEFNLALPEIREFWEAVLPNTKRIILTGAGTSAFIGISLRGIFQQITGIPTEAIATTDIVTHPQHYFLENEPTLLISFARSGNSPESSAVLDLADDCCKTCYHLVITCNKEGNLAKHHSNTRKYTFILPKEANDNSLAMTSSYSGMLLAGLLFAKLDQLQENKTSIELVARYAADFITDHTESLREIARLPFTRAVFLGAGALYGTATEANLKIQEFTGGKVIGKHDSYLGFRHGPKSVIDGNTLLVYFISSQDKHSLQYEIDLIDSIKKGTAPLLEIGVSESPYPDLCLPYNLYFSDSPEVGDESFLCLPYILIAQILGFFKSLELNLQPDAPSVNNDITRVVEGVKIYSWA